MKLMAIYDCWDKCESNSLTELIKSDEAAKNAKMPLKISPDISRKLNMSEISLVRANSQLYNHLGEETSDLDKVTPLVQLRFNYYMDKLETRIDSVIHCLMSMSVVCKFFRSHSNLFPSI
jgi:hypothetical protein